jgi:hypothetical protein
MSALVFRLSPDVKAFVCGMGFISRSGEGKQRRILSSMLLVLQSSLLLIVESDT